MNIIGYIKKHNEEDFNTFAFTEVDNLILSLLPYLDLQDIVPNNKNKITLEEAYHLFQNKKTERGSIFNGNMKSIFKEMAHTKRYSSILLSHYVNIVNEEMQFGAITCILPNKITYIAFAGTDSSIIGWEEDFKMAYLYPGISQKYAAHYLSKTIGLFHHNILVGGHSKGGNLAISSVMLSNKFIRSKIKAIYNNDGPGFLKEQIESKEYRSIEKKIKMFVPKDSIIGMLLYHIDNYIVVKARGFNIIQHDAFNWLCDNDSFIQDKQTTRSKNLEKKLTKKLEELSIPRRMELVNALFGIFKKKQIKDAKDIKITDLFQFVKQFKELDKDTQNLLVEFLMILFIR